MGTNVHLVWKNQSKKEKEQQFTGFSIDAGKVGYLRASIGMTTENCFLRLLFPDHWEGGEPKPYDFNSPENLKRLHACAIGYLVTVLTGKQLLHRKHEKMEKFGKELKNTLSSLRAGKVEAPGTLGLAHSVMWLNSVFEFFRLGQEKQGEGLEPVILIRW